VDTFNKEMQERTKVDEFDLTFTMLTRADHGTRFGGNDEPD
jgi:hypothetical protein